MVDEVMQAFDDVLVRHFPMATTGDLSPQRTVALKQALDEAIREWIWNNAVDQTTDENVA